MVPGLEHNQGRSADRPWVHVRQDQNHLCICSQIGHHRRCGRNALSLMDRAVQLTGITIPRYAKYTPTVIGAYSVPRWYEPLDRLVTMGQLSPADMADAEFLRKQSAMLEQEV